MIPKVDLHNAMSTFKLTKTYPVRISIFPGHTLNILLHSSRDIGDPTPVPQMKRQNEYLDPSRFLRTLRSYLLLFLLTLLSSSHDGDPVPGDGTEVAEFLEADTICVNRS